MCRLCGGVDRQVHFLGVYGVGCVVELRVPVHLFWVCEEGCVQVHSLRVCGVGCVVRLSVQVHSCCESRRLLGGVECAGILCGVGCVMELIYKYILLGYVQ